MLIYILFAIGFVMLAKGADVLVSGASAIARRFNISEMVVGLTIVSMGTSMPELIVNVLASLKGQPDLAIGNIFGSNVANVLLIIGITAIICPLPLRRSTILSEIPFSLIATLLVGFLANVAIFQNKPTMMITRTEGLVLLFFFLLFMAYIFIAKTNKDPEIQDSPSMSMPKAVIFVLIGIFALFLGGKWVVDGAVNIAQYFGLSESFIGLTIVAIGTSLPELVTSVLAAYRKNIDIAVGNVIGSNIFNLLWILGITAVVNPIPFNLINNFDVMVMIASSTLLILVLPFGHKNAIGRVNGVFFVLLYAAYLVFLIYRG